MKGAIPDQIVSKVGSQIFHTIRLLGSVSKNEIKKRLGVSATTVNSTVHTLIQEGYIQQSGVGQSTGGRKPLLFEINPSLHFVICASLKNTTITVAKLSLNGDVICRYDQNTGEAKGNAYLDQFIVLLEVFIQEKIENMEYCKGISVVSPGVVDGQQGRILYNSRLAIFDVPLKDKLEEKFGLPVYLENDTNSFVTAERYMGLANQKNMLYVTIGDGVGSGVLVNGSVYRGQNGSAGEIGHTTVVPGGVKCTCNNRGCLESYVGWPAIHARILSALLTQRYETVFSDWVRCEYQKITPELFVSAVNQADELALQIVYELAEYIATALVNVLHLLSPDIIIMSGKVIQGNNILLERIEEILSERKLPTLNKKQLIKTSSLHENLELLGAMAVACDEQFQTMVAMPEN
ncbi:ROK family transcriptional regulator [Virgibacillus natechei]